MPSRHTENRAEPRGYNRRVPFGYWLLAALSGLMLTASFAPLDLSYLAWIALVPLLISLQGRSRRQAFKLGFVAGACHYLTLIYWIVVVLGHYGGLNFLASLGPLILLCLYLALYPALFSVLNIGLRRSPLALLFGAAAWAGLEYARAVFLTGFPWCLLGYSQYRHLHLIQVADLFGVYGLSFLIVLVNGLGFRIWARLFRSGLSMPKWEIVLTSACMGLTLGYGHYRLGESKQAESAGGNIRVAVVQGNIDQSVKWKPEYQQKTVAVYERLTIASADFRPQLTVWPETAVPFFFQEPDDNARRVIAIAEASGGALLFGSPAYERSDEGMRYLNRAYLIDPSEHSVRHYDKVHLVPFGEYVPLKRFLFFIQRLVPAAGDFATGDRVSPLRLGDASIGVLICFEAIFPDLARRLSEQGAHVLVNLTNDAWFGKTSAPSQHLAMAAFRAVETRRPLVRAANTGISAFVRPSGEIGPSGPLFQEAVLTGEVSLSASGLPFYARHGDLFAQFMLIVTLGRLLALPFLRKRTRLLPP